MKVYKGMNKDMQCTPNGKVFQYEPGKTYEKPEAKLCEHGFHACEAPLDVLRYYAPADGSRYFEAELDDVSPEKGDDSKVCGKKITIGAEIGIPGLAKAHVEWVKEQCEKSASNKASGESGNAAASGYCGNAAASGDWGNAAASGKRGNAAASGDCGNAAASGVSGNAAASGYCGNAAASGDWGNAAASGDWGNAAASGKRGNAAASGYCGNAAASGVSGNAAASGKRGNAAASGVSGNAAASGVRGTAVSSGMYGTAEANGEQTIAVAWGAKSKAKGAVGSWIVCTEHDEDGTIVNARMAFIDGVTIKPDTWYTLEIGEFVEVKE